MSKVGDTETKRPNQLAKRILMKRGKSAREMAGMYKIKV